ncbi:hypothetical protein CISIN_1g0102392mg, partial [Citrus sinensis]
SFQRQRGLRLRRSRPNACK